MYNQTEAILAQYELEIQQTIKGRSSYICETSRGAKSLVPFRGSKEKGEFLREYLQALKRSGFFVEQIELNKNAAAVTVDEITGERFLLKDYIKGTEISTTDLEALIKAIELLADYHNKARELEIEIPDLIKDSATQVVEVRRKHYKELIKVKNYIRGRKKKNEFDQIFLKAYEPMIQTAERSLVMLEAVEEPVCDICHGDFNQHNVLYSSQGICLVNFENFCYGWSVVDLANFLRKMLEKNDWDFKIGKMLIEAYDKKCLLERAGYAQLYGLLLFPEKFWKVSNHYMNSRKSWISEKDIEKLKKTVEQEEGRKDFVQKMFSFLG